MNSLSHPLMKGLDVVLTTVQCLAADVDTHGFNADIVWKEREETSQKTKKLLLHGCGLSLSQINAHLCCGPRQRQSQTSWGTLWRPFWEQFCVSVHNRPNLSDSVYLQSALKEGSAKRAIEGLSRSGEHGSISRHFQCSKI